MAKHSSFLVVRNNSPVHSPAYVFSLPSSNLACAILCFYPLLHLPISSMIKDISIRRANIASSGYAPVQWSENLQIAINTTTHLTVLDPKIPLIHQTIATSPLDKGSTNILDPLGLYDINTVLDLDRLEAIGVRCFNSVVITDTETFSIGRIAEPTITAHQWSGIDPRTRDCYLGVLLSTSELLVLKRDTIDPSNYTVVYKVFNNLLDQLYLPQENLAKTGEILLSNTQALSIKVKTFTFNKANIGHDAIFFLSIGNSCGQISLHVLEQTLPKKLVIDLPGGENHTKQVWSEWSQFKGNTLVSHLAVATPKNAILLYTVLYDYQSKKMELIQDAEIFASTRFLLSQLQFQTIEGIVYLFLTTSYELQIFKLMKHKPTFVVKTPLSYRSSVSGLIITSNKDNVGIRVAYENGKFEQFRLQGPNIIEDHKEKELSHFVNKALYKFQLVKGKASENDGGNDGSQPLQTSSDNSVFKEYLYDNVEGSITNFASQLNPKNGIVVVAYKIVPKNIINYTQLSKSDFNIGFIPIEELSVDFSTLQTTFESSTISFISNFWFNKYSEIPVVPRLIEEKDMAKDIESFVDAVSEFKARHFKAEFDLLTSASKGRSDTLAVALIESFSRDTKVNSLHKLFNFNFLLLKSLALMTVKGCQSSKLSSLYEEVKSEQLQIERHILAAVGNIVLRFVKQSKKANFSERDEFTLISYYNILTNMLNQRTIEAKFLPQNDVSVSIQTEFFGEEFTTSVNEISDDSFDNAKLVNSTTNHKWPRCKLTMLPILDMKNEIDEFQLFNYKSVYPDDPVVLSELQATLNYCIYTGNKKYNV